MTAFRSGDGAGPPLLIGRLVLAVLMAALLASSVTFFATAWIRHESLLPLRAALGERLVLDIAQRLADRSSAAPAGATAQEDLLPALERLLADCLRRHSSLAYLAATDREGKLLQVHGTLPPESAALLPAFSLAALRVPQGRTRLVGQRVHAARALSPTPEPQGAIVLHLGLHGGWSGPALTRLLLESVGLGLALVLITLPLLLAGLRAGLVRPWQRLETLLVAVEQQDFRGAPAPDRALSSTKRGPDQGAIPDFRADRASHALMTARQVVAQVNARYRDLERRAGRLDARSAAREALSAAKSPQGRLAAGHAVPGSGSGNAPASASHRLQALLHSLGGCFHFSSESGPGAGTGAGAGAGAGSGASEDLQSRLRPGLAVAEGARPPFRRLLLDPAHPVSILLGALADMLVLIGLLSWRPLGLGLGPGLDADGVLPPLLVPGGAVHAPGLSEATAAGAGSVLSLSILAGYLGGRALALLLGPKPDSMRRWQGGVGVIYALAGLMLFLSLPSLPWLGSGLASVGIGLLLLGGSASNRDSDINQPPSPFPFPSPFPSTLHLWLGEDRLLLCLAGGLAGLALAPLLGDGLLWVGLGLAALILAWLALSITLQPRHRPESTEGTESTESTASEIPPRAAAGGIDAPAKLRPLGAPVAFLAASFLALGLVWGGVALLPQGLGPSLSPALASLTAHFPGAALGLELLGLAVLGSVATGGWLLATSKGREASLEEGLSLTGLTGALMAAADFLPTLEGRALALVLLAGLSGAALALLCRAETRATQRLMGGRHRLGVTIGAATIALALLPDMRPLLLPQGSFGAVLVGASALVLALGLVLLMRERRGWPTGPVLWTLVLLAMAALPLALLQASASARSGAPPPPPPAPVLQQEAGPLGLTETQNPNPNPNPNSSHIGEYRGPKA